MLKYLHEDGESIEPEYYLPIIPMILVNGADGIGTGWSTSIPNFNPRDLIANIHRKIDGEELTKMDPHYFGFNGTIESDISKAGSYIVSGKIERLDDTTLHISELPIKSWTQDYKMFLEKLMVGDDKKKTEPEIKDFKENHTDTTVSFTVTAEKTIIDKFEKEKDGLYGKFKLRTKLSTSNMNMFDKHGRIVKYKSPEALLDSFYRERLRYYDLRKDHLLKELRRDQRMLSNKARFVEEVCSGDLVISNRKRADILSELQARDYEVFHKQNNNLRPNETESESEDDQGESNDGNLAKGYDYLLGMKIWSLTYEKAQKLRNELADKTKTVEDLEATTPKQLWRNDLKVLEDALDERDVAYAEAAEEELKAQGKNKKHQASKKKKQTKRKAAKVKSSSSEDSDEDFFEAPAKKKVANKKPTKSASTASRVQVHAKVTQKKGLDKLVKIDEEESNSDSLNFHGSDDTISSKMTTKKATSSKTAAKRVTKSKIAKAPQSSPTVFELDSDSETEEISLFDRMRKKSKTASKPITSTSKTTKRSGTKRASPKASMVDSDDDLGTFDTTSYEPASLTPAPKKKKVSRIVAKKVIQVDESDDDDDIFDEHDDDQSSDEEENVPTPKPRSRTARTRKKITYDIDDSDEEESDDEFSFDG